MILKNLLALTFIIKIISNHEQIINREQKPLATKPVTTTVKHPLPQSYLEEVLDVVSGRCGRVILEQRVIELEAADLPPAQEARLTHIEVEVLERAVAEAHHGLLLADRALGVVAGGLGDREPVQHGQPHEGLRLPLEPREEVGEGEVAGAVGVLEAGADRGLHVGAAEGRHLAQLLGDEDEGVEEEG